MKTASLLPLLRTLMSSAIVSVLLPATLAAQTTAARPDRGIMPGASYSVSDIENINLSNGNLQLTIPLASLPPIAGGKLKLTLNATYNSKLWNITRTENKMGTEFSCPSWVVDNPQESDLGGWRIAAGYRIVFREAQEDFDFVQPNPPPTPDCETNLIEQAELQHQLYRAILISPDGAEHELRPIDNIASYGGVRSYLSGYYRGTPDTVGLPTRYYSFDGSYLWATINPSSHSTHWTITLKDGTRVVQYSNGIQRITDTNGNSIKMFSDSAGTHIQDEQTGREIRATDNQIWYQKPGGGWANITIVWGTTTVQGKLYRVNNWVPTGGEFGGGSYCWFDRVLNHTLPVIREIVFPQTEATQPAQRYLFSYNSDETATASHQALWSCSSGETYNRTVSNGLGGLSQITTPTGAVVKYSYSKDGKHSFSLFGDTDDIPRETLTKKEVVHDGITDTWTYNIIESNSCGGTVTAPDGSVTTETCYPKNPAQSQFFGNVPAKAGLTYRSRRSNVELVERQWTTMPFSGANQLSTGSFANATFNPVVAAEYTTLLDGSNPVKMSATIFQYDFNGNVTQTTEYDWFDPALVSRDAVGVPTGVPSGATVLRVTNNFHYNQAAASSSANVYAKRSISTGAPRILNALQQTTVGPSIVQLSYDGQAYGVAPTIGNVTTKKLWVDLDSKWITTSNTYDSFGNVLTATDPRGKVTKFFYDDATHALPNRVVVDPQNATGTQTTTTVFDYHTGRVTSQTDVNDQQSTIDYTNHLLGAIDPFGRPGVTKAPTINISGANHQRFVKTTYVDSARQVIVEGDLNAENDKLLKTRTTADMLGRHLLTEGTEDGTNYTISVTNAYFNMGKVTLTSSPRRSTATNTDSWTRVSKDDAGRVIEVATFGGAAQPGWTGTAGVFTGAATTAYFANFTTVTDQAGKVRRSMTDALGRLTRVDEPDANGNPGSTSTPVQPTSYAYNVLDSLTTVTQGSQTRTFTYDSSSRLRSAVNPESGTITYKYDDNANLLVRTDARGASAHFEYDGINRVTRRWYNGSNSTSETTHNSPALPGGVGTTNEAKWFYDTQALPGGAPSYSRGSAVGRLVAQTYGTGSNGDYYSYDVLGRQTIKIQQTATINYQVSASYKLSGALDTLTYPSGHTINNVYDQAGRLMTFSGSLGGGNTRMYSGGMLYSAVGTLVKEQFGTATPIYNKLFYNSRGQLAEIRASTSYTGPTDFSADRGAIVNNYSNCTGICSGSSMPDNNGNLRKQEIHIPGQTMRYQQYEYDSLNRLNLVREVLDGGAEQWKQQFTYDPWGNRTINTSVTYGVGINNKAFNVNATNNRLEVPSGQSGVMQYDAVGNLTNDTYSGAGNRTYDGENKITSAWGGNNQAQLYAYDASGQRIKRTVDGVETWHVYGLGGELLAEYPAHGAAASPQKEYGYRNGDLLITAPPLIGGDHSLSLNGTSAYVQVPNSSSLNITGSITVEAWIKPNSIGTYQYIVSRETYGVAGTGGGFELTMNNLGKARFDLYHSHNTYTPVIGNTVLTTGVWHHVAGVWDGTYMRIFVDGLLDGTMTTGNGPASGSSSVKLGRNSGGSYFNGLIDEARVSNAAVYTSSFTPQMDLTATANAKGLWKFDGQSATDSSTNGNNGTVQGGAVYSNDVPTGPAYHSLSVNGTNAYVQVPNSSSLNLTGPITVEAWIKPNSIGTYQYIVSRETYGVAGTGGGFELTMNNLGKARFDLYHSHNTYTPVIGNTVLTTDVWHHVAGVWDGTYMRIFVDGLLDGTMTTGNGPASGSSSVKLGRNSGGSYFNGLIDEARVSNAAVYSSNFTPQTHLTAGANTKGLWKFDGQVATDASTNGNNGTLHGGAVYSNDVPSCDGGGGSGGGAVSQLQWLVSDHLGTARMIFDQTGSLANVKRHDYLPFGEELFVPAGGRNAAMGYLGGDGVRQQFTEKERDNETGLDYFLARYYSSIQGRFTSVDPGSFVPADPQSWNRYLYTQNNPLKFTDPTGDDLYITGDYADQLVADLQSFSGFKLQRDTKTGKVTIDPKQKRNGKGTSYALARALEKAIGNEKVSVSIKTVSELKDNVEVLEDSFVESMLDIDDYNVYKRDAPQAAAGFLTHVVTEYYEAQLLPVPLNNVAIYNQAHKYALETESETIGDLNGWWQAPRKDQRISGAYTSPPSTVRFIYSTVQYDVTYKAGVKGRATQVEKVTKIDKTPKKPK